MVKKTPLQLDEKQKSSNCEIPNCWPFFVNNANGNILTMHFSEWDISKNSLKKVLIRNSSTFKDRKKPFRHVRASLFGER
jgi:hypothetical protein